MDVTMLRNNKSVCFLMPLLLCGIYLMIQPTESARILCLAAQGHSHIGEVIGAAEKLQDYGHDVYLVLNDRYPKPEQYEKRGLRVLKYHLPMDEAMLSSKEFQDRACNTILTGRDAMELNVIVGQLIYRDCRYMMADQQLMETIHSLNFDLMVFDGFPICPCNVIVPAYFKVPYVTVSAIFTPLDAGVPFMPHFMTTILTEFSDRMNLLQKFQNALGLIMIKHIPFSSNTDLSLLQEHNITETWQSIVNKAELFIVSSNYVLEWPIPTMPNLINVPGLSSSKPTPLNDQFSQLMDTPHGVIVMTFGSQFPQLTDELISKFLSAFTRLDQTVLWKLSFKPDQKYELPPNVHVFQWLPQASLLAHANTKVFITHCGNGGQHEAVYHGVPMLGVPLFAEQPHNAFRMEQHGIGRRLHFLSMTSDDIYENITELLSNPSYREKSQKMSRILNDRPMSGQEEAAYWINHVIQFGGAHMRSSTMDMPLWEFWMLDMLMVVIMCLILVILVLVCFVRVIFKKLKGKTVSSEEKKLQ